MLRLKKAETPKLTKKQQRLAWRAHQINVIGLCAVMLAGTLFMWFGKRPTYSEEEKRDLTKRPKFTVSSYLDGTFTSEYAKYFNDSVPLRSFFKHRIAVFRDHLGFTDDVEIHGGVPARQDDQQAETLPAETLPAETVPGMAATESAVSVTEPMTTEPPEEEEDVDGEMTNNIFIVKDRGLMLYGGGMQNGQNYAGILNRYHEALGSGVRVYSLVAPTSVSFYLPKKYSDMSASEPDNIDNINAYLDGVTPVDAYTALESHKKEDIYMRTDHHWSSLGAYYAAEEFAKVAGVPFAPLPSYEKHTLDGYVGTLYGYSGSSKLKDNPEEFTYYIPQNSYTCTYYDTDMTNEREAPLFLNPENLDTASWYLVFMGGDERITHLKTDTHNGRKLCIIKDSYGNAMVPTLTGSFEDVWVVDMRYFDLNIIDFLQEQGITDLLFAMNTYSATGGNARNLKTLLDQ